MSIDKIAELAVSISRTVDDNQKLATPLLANKLKQGMNSFPHDQTIRMLANIVSKLSEKQFLISRGELKKLYNQFYTRNNKCAQFLQEELGEMNNLSTPTLSQRKDEVNEVDTSSQADQVLANALESVFDKNTSLKMYGKDVALKATASVKKSLDECNLKASSVIVEDGNSEFLVVKADYDTPKGKTSFYVPIEVNGNKINESFMFMGNSGLKELNHLNVKNYLSTHAGSKLKVNASQILNILTQASSSKKQISDAELALARIKAAKISKNAEIFGGQITGIKVEEPALQDVQLPELNEKETFASKFESEQGIAVFKFSAEKVKSGIVSIARSLSNFGIKNPRIKVSSSDKNTIFYAVSLNDGSTGFVVPIKVNADKVGLPSVIICNGSLSAFSAENIIKLQKNNYSDKRASAVASPVYGLKPSDLVNQVREAMKEKNVARAEDALNVLKQSGDAKAYLVAFKVFSNGLVSEASAEEEKTESTCKMVVKNSSSQHPVCGHTGLPLHKVYQDEHGNCRPMYRKGMDESYEGAYFMNHKIFG